MNPQVEKPILPTVSQSPVWESEHLPEGSIDLFALLSSYVGRWPLLLLSVLLGGAVFYAASYAVRPSYQAEAVFLPPPEQHSFGDNPLAALWSSGSTAAIYPGLLRSRSVVDIVIHTLNLQPVYKAKDLEAARAVLLSHTNVSSDAAGFYRIGVTEHDPELARKIADAYLNALVQVNTRLGVQSATQQEAVFERELRREKDALDVAQEDLSQHQVASGVVSPQAQTQSGLTAIDQLRVQIQAREVQLSALRESETEAAPEVVRLRSEIATLQGQLHTMEQGSENGAGAGLSARRAPEANLEFLRLQREVQFHQSLYEIITRQFESSNMQVRTASTNVQIVDYPETPRRKSAPSRRLWALAGAMVCFGIVIVTIFIGDRMRAIRSHPERRRAAATLRDTILHPRWTF